MSNSVSAGRARAVVIGIVLVLGIAAVTVWRVVLAKPRMPANTIFLSGRIEGDDSAVAPKATGRMLEIRVREGDLVKAGDTIAVLDDPQVRAREDQAQAAWRSPKRTWNRLATRSRYLRTRYGRTPRKPGSPSSMPKAA